MKKLEIKTLLKLATLVIVIIAIIVIGCRKETEMDNYKKMNPKSAMDVQDTILPDSAMTGYVTFINQSLSDNGVQDDYKVNDAFLFSESFANYLFTADDTISKPFSNDSTLFTVAITSLNGVNIITHSSINSLLNSMNTYYSNKARDLGFKENSNLHFKYIDLIWDESTITDNSITVTAKTLISDASYKKPGGCNWNDAFANPGIGRGPWSSEGACYNPPYDANSGNNWACFEIESALNTPGISNNYVGCIHTYRVAAPHDFEVYKWIYIKTAVAVAWVDNQPVFNSNMWNGLNLTTQQPYVCISADDCQGYYNHIISSSLAMQPNYTFPNTSITVKKDIVAYKYTYTLNDFSDSRIPPDYWGHDCYITYAICLYAPVEITASKNPKNWRDML